MITESVTLNEQNTGATLSLSAGRPLTTRRLMNNDAPEILAFLRERALHTVVMSGFIRDNGIESTLNRGSFYACRNELGKLEGVALVGHAMFIEARSGRALEVFARLAQEFRHVHMIMGEEEIIERFWDLYSEEGQPPRRLCREILFELSRPADTCAPVPNLRLAKLDELSLVMPVHAALAFEESGVNPLNSDPQGFEMRCRRRIEQGRVWVWIEHGELIFKIDIISDTPDVTYLEGAHVHPGKRGKGYGLRCITDLSRRLLQRSKSISVLVNQENPQAQKLFQKAGFAQRGLYDTIFLHRQTPGALFNQVNGSANAD